MKIKNQTVGTYPRESSDEKKQLKGDRAREGCTEIQQMRPCGNGIRPSGDEPRYGGVRTLTPGGRNREDAVCPHRKSSVPSDAR